MSSTLAHNVALALPRIDHYHPKTNVPALDERTTPFIINGEIVGTMVKKGPNTYTLIHHYDLQGDYDPPKFIR